MKLRYAVLASIFAWLVNASTAGQKSANSQSLFSHDHMCIGMDSGCQALPEAV